MELLLFIAAGLTAAAVAWLGLRAALPSPPALDGWVRAGEAAGLSGLDRDELRGTAGPFEVRLAVHRGWLRTRAQLVVPRPPDGMSDGAAELAERLGHLVVRSRWDEAAAGDATVAEALRDRDAVVALVTALGDLDDESDGLSCVLSRRFSAQHGTSLQSLLVLLPWVATRLGWARATDDERLAATATDDPDPMVRQRALLRLLGGWTTAAPVGELQETTAAAAVRDSDPWVSAVAAVHLGATGVAALDTVLGDPQTADVLTLQIVDVAGAALPEQTLARLLTHADLDIVSAAATHLAVVGTSTTLSALRAVGLSRRLNPLGPAQAISKAISSIEARLSEHAGRLSEAGVTQPGGELTVVDDTRGGLSEP